MIIFKSKCVYVQKNDLGFLNSADIAIPASIYSKVFGSGYTIINDNNRYDFVKFDEDSEIDFFKGLDWMINYDKVKDLSEEEINKLLVSIAEENDSVVKKYNAMSPEERAKHPDMAQRCDQLEFKFYSLRDVLWFKQGHITMELPETGIKKSKKKKTSSN
jgi:hypothetical protein